MFQTKVLEKIKTHISCSAIPPPRKSCRSCSNVENTVQVNRPQITVYYSACALDTGIQIF